MPKPYKIAVIRPDSNPLQKGFYNSQEIGLARGLAELGCEVDVFMAGVSSKIRTDQISSDQGKITVYEMPFFTIPEISQAIYPALIKTLGKKEYDLVQVNEENELTCFWVARYARKNNIRCIVYQGMYKQLSGRIRAAFQRFYDIFLLPTFRKNITRAFTKTNRARLHLERKGFRDIQVIPVGIDTAVFKNYQDRNWYRELSLPAEAKVILYIGVFEKRRNPEFLVELGQKLATDGYHLVMAGDGPLLETTRETIRKNGTTNVHLVGKVAQINLPSLYRLADLFLLPSTYEIYGMVLLESLYFGCPVISTRTAGAEDLLRDGFNGYILDEVDPELWSQCILTHCKAFDRMAIARHIEENYTWSAIAKSYLDAAFDNDATAWVQENEINSNFDRS